MLESIIFIFVLLFSMVIHEFAHAWTANRLGDSTAKDMGRLSLNPLRHIDTFGTVILPASLIALRFLGVVNFVFAYAKPVPVNFMRLRNPKRDMMFVGLAGPFVNLLSAVFFALILKMVPPGLFFEIIGLFILINLLLACFNLIPIPPLDGSRFFMGILPKNIVRYYARIEPYGIYIVVLVLWFTPLGDLILPVVQHLADILGVKII